MANFIPTIPLPKNEPVLNYLPDSKETKTLKHELSSLSSNLIDIPVVVNGKEIRTGKTESCILPHNHRHKVATYHMAGAEETHAAIEGALRAQKDWANWSLAERAGVFLRAAELLATKYRPILNAATMLGQSKTCYQAEIDSACELVDFFKFNCHFAETLCEMQPISAPGQWNTLEYRPLEGFVFAVTPFNFTSIAGNLPTSPAILGNVAIWKPASTSVYSGHFIMKLLTEAGLPPGVIQFLPGSGKAISEVVLKDANLAGVHFTGSTGVFQDIWKKVGDNIANYRSYPRLVGETGGKDFVMVHTSAEVDSVVTALIRGAFEYQGQKCSAASRAYLPKSLWPKIKERMVAEVATIGMGDVTDFRHFMSAVIDKSSFGKIKNYIDEAKRSSDASILCGGKCNDETGYFIEPTVIEAKTPGYRTLCEEIFGPVLTVYVYDDNKFDDTLALVDKTSPYALTGAVISNDRAAIQRASDVLRNAAGNFYINNKPTGAVVGQQPFGGARASGTNDKAGSLLNLLRWTSVRTISETLVPPRDYRYPFMG